jgi:iron complex transport system substrate-binding protein
MTKGLASTGGVKGLIALPGVAQTDAGKSKRIISVDDSLLLSFGPRTPNLILQLRTALEKVVKQ